MSVHCLLAVLKLPKSFLKDNSVTRQTEEEITEKSYYGCISSSYRFPEIAQQVINSTRIDMYDDFFFLIDISQNVNVIIRKMMKK